jgi:hypothetical protein
MNPDKTTAAATQQHSKQKKKKAWVMGWVDELICFN